MESTNPAAERTGYGPFADNQSFLLLIDTLTGVVGSFLTKNFSGNLPKVAQITEPKNIKP
ncbi:hypothetical protein AGMMS49579_18300 [Spirochaetia bacterium]|nr:hypothetical protein AGMMS49579_18300 [Spirochaetia bacterium]